MKEIRYMNYQAKNPKKHIKMVKLRKMIHEKNENRANSKMRIEQKKTAIWQRDRKYKQEPIKFWS